jgi:putative ABC transport system permease protein
MKNIYFSIQRIFRPTWMNFIKIASLALGICISTVLICRVAWDQSFDSFWSQGENLLFLEMHYDFKVKELQHLNGPDIRCCPAIAPEIVEKIPEFELATRFVPPFEREHLVGDKAYLLMTYHVDSPFFDVLKIKMLSGNSKEILKAPEQVIISKKTAEMLFPAGNALGQQISLYKKNYTICGICEDLPKNSGLPSPQVIYGRVEIPRIFDGMSSFFTILRTHQKPDIKTLNQKINALLVPIYAEIDDAFEVTTSFSVSPLQDYHKRMVAENDTIMLVLAFVLLLIAGLNFALLSISSLTSRAKEMGVRKTAGAKTSGIFALIIFETVIYVTLAALLSALIFLGFKQEIETMAGLYEDIFAFRNLWATGVVFITQIIIAGIIPAWIFSKIPVTQVFQRFTWNRLYGKRVLLFIQFTASILVICFMFIIINQYKTSIMRQYGYDHEKLLWTTIPNLSETQCIALLDDIKSDSRVEDITLSSEQIWWGFSGVAVSIAEDYQKRLSIRWLVADSSFFKTYGIPILLGSNNLTTTYSDGGNVVVNQAFLEAFNILEHPVGKTIDYEGTPATIVGVCANIETIYNGVQPLLITGTKPGRGHYLTIRVNEVTKDVVETVRKKIEPHYINAIVPEVALCSDTIFQAYNDIRKNRDIVLIASIFLLLITIMGVLGYVNIEIKHRTKEIAIRKIHGSNAINVVWMVSKELVLIAILAAAVAIPLSYFSGIRWQREFLIKAPMSWDIFALGALIIILTIIICTTLQSWKIANSNPSKSIKSE